MKRQASFRINEQLHEKLKLFANSQGITTSQLIELACYEFMDENPIPTNLVKKSTGKQKKIEKILLDIQVDQPTYKKLAEIATAKNSTLSQEVYYRVSASLTNPIFDTQEFKQIAHLHFDLNRLGNLFKIAINNKMPVNEQILNDIKTDIFSLSEEIDNFSPCSDSLHINAKTNLIVDVKTIRTGRKITDLEFTISDKSKAIDVTKRPKFPHKNKYGKFVRLDRQNPKNSSAEYGLWARDCLKILEDFYSKIEDVPKEDLLFYWIFLTGNASNKSKFGNRQVFVDELKRRGYKIKECELEKTK